MGKTYFQTVLAELMDEYELNQMELAKALEMKQSQVSNWLCGKSKPNYNSIKALSDYFKISADMLCDTAFNEDN